MEAYRTEGWDTERRGSDLQSGNQFEYHAFPQTLDELELEFKIEAMELGRIRDKEEDEENYKHRKGRGVPPMWLTKEIGILDFKAPLGNKLKLFISTVYSLTSI
ncbi:hypothetical protein V6Z12_A12G023700 [Gossypium hirsutum]